MPGYGKIREIAADSGRLGSESNGAVSCANALHPLRKETRDRAHCDGEVCIRKQRFVRQFDRITFHLEMHRLLSLLLYDHSSTEFSFK
jgi:hypothetical protein